MRQPASQERFLERLFTYCVDTDTLLWNAPYVSLPGLAWKETQSRENIHVTDRGGRRRPAKDLKCDDDHHDITFGQKFPLNVENNRQVDGKVMTREPFEILLGDGRFSFALSHGEWVSPCAHSGREEAREGDQGFRDGQMWNIRG